MTNEEIKYFTQSLKTISLELKVIAEEDGYSESEIRKKIYRIANRLEDKARILEFLLLKEE